jgi:1-deoxyxylulose-5-phosphate synthase
MMRAMDYVRLGRTGLKVSRICLGCMSYGSPAWRDWVLSEEAARPFIQRALELGINFFDTADMYSLGASEEVVGRALRDFARRDEVVLATKVYFSMGDKPNQGGLSRKHILAACDDSLRRLGVDYIDLYQIHRWDYDTPIEETLEALDDLVRSGKVRYIGASSMFSWQLAKALYLADLHGWTRFVSMQNHYNLIYREEEREMLPLCREEGLGVVPWSPLARGFLTGSRRRGGEAGTTRARSDSIAQMYSDQDFDVVDRVLALAERRGAKPAHIGLAWLLHQPGVTAPIVGATRMEHLEDAVAALEVRLDDAERRELEEPYQPHKVLGHE